MPKVGNALTDEQRELQELRKQVKRLTMERDIFLKKASCSAGLGQPERLSLISKLPEQDKRASKKPFMQVVWGIEEQLLLWTKAQAHQP